MKLLLTSAWLSNKSISNALLELVWKPFEELNLIFIPTAANAEEGDKGWLINDLINCKNLGFKQIDIVDISAVSKDIWLPRLEKADIILFGWWNSFYLMDSIEKSWLKDILPNLLETRVFVWISAWSMITCEDLDLNANERLYCEIVWENPKNEGFWFVDFIFRPHLNNSFFPNLNLENLEILSTEFPDTFYVIDDNTAIKIIDDKIEVISEGIWKKFN